MPDNRGHIELDRRIETIVVGVRHRKDMGDVEGLMRSIDEVGLLQPITITPDGVLVCGARRLEAMRRLGHRSLSVWVRSGISDALSHLLAQQDENSNRKPLSPLEAHALYLEVKELMKEEAARRQEASRFGAPADNGELNGAEDPSAPRGGGDTRVQASRFVTGGMSFQRLEHIGWLKQVASDQSQVPHVREFAQNVLAAIQDGAPVEPGYKRVRAAVELASNPKDNDPDAPDSLTHLAAEALARVRQRDARKGARGLKRTHHDRAPSYRTLRSFILTWTELEGWSALYDIEALATGLEPDEWERFERVVTETVEFARMLRTARQTLVPA